MKRFAIALIGVISLSACAQQPGADAAGGDGDGADAVPSAIAAPRIEIAPGSPDDLARKAILSINPNLVIDQIGPAPLSGFREVVLAGQTFYVSDDGRYLLQGSLFDMVEKRDLSEAGVARARLGVLAQIPQADRIVFSPPNPKHTVTVFTDVECGYCRKLHDEIAEYNKRGIAIEYLAYPRAGLGSDDARLMADVWCAADRNKALTDAKTGKRVAHRECANPVATHYQAGQRVGLTGTPMILGPDGAQLGGYLPPEALLSVLEDRAKASAGGQR